MNTTKTDKTDEILARLERIEDLLLRRGKPRKTLASIALDHGGDTLLRARVAEVERVFWKIVNASPGKRRDSYRYPRCLIEPITQTYHNQVVIASVLVNQASLRKIFRPIHRTDPTAAEAARAALEQSTLITCRLLDCGYPGGDSTTLVVLSPGEALRKLRDQSLIPRQWKGWSCDERAIPQRRADGELHNPPEDPCGRRVWDGELSKPVVDLTAFETSSEGGGVEFLEEDEPAEVEVIPVKKSTVTGIDFGGGYSTRVQFPEDED